ncbi:MAG: hypothetical protein B7Z72_14455, partial [Gemmatimonadetes bacterium 21-71-4]
MLSSRFRPWHVPLFIGKYAWLTMRRMPVLVHFEVTLRCNARCGFCDYWKTHPSARDQELASFADAAHANDAPSFDVMTAQVAAMDAVLTRRGRDPESLHRVLLHFGGD